MNTPSNKRQSRLLLGSLLIFFLIWFWGLQVSFQTDRFIWFSMFSSKQSGEAIVQDLRQEKRLNLTYYTIYLKGVEDTPNFSIHNAFSAKPYKVETIHQRLKSVPIGDKVSVQWKQPLWRKPFYISIEGDSNILESLVSCDWIIASCFSLAMIAIIGCLFTKCF